MCIISMQVFLISEAPVSIRTMFYCTVLSSWWCDIGVKSSMIFLLTIVIYRCSASKKHDRGFGMRTTFTVTRVVGVDTGISQTEQDCTARTIAALNTPKTRVNLLTANSVSCGSFWEACLLPRNSVGPGASSTLGGLVPTAAVSWDTTWGVVWGTKQRCWVSWSDSLMYWQHSQAR